MKTKGTISLMKVKPSALKTDILLLYETLGFLKQSQIRNGYIPLGNGAYKKGTS